MAATGVSEGLRLFDDAPHMHGLTIDGVDSAFENFAELIANPVTDMLIVSFSFGDKIKRKIEAEFGPKIRALTITELLERGPAQ
jgi:hypothetical protein